MTTPTNHKLAVAVIGYTGGVGQCLIQAMERIGLQPFALVRSSTMKLRQDGTNDDYADEIPTDYQLLSTKLLEVSKSTNVIPVIADVTASSSLQTQHYKTWLQQSINICTANKYIFAGPEQDYQDLLKASQVGNCKLLHEATVGAGLPILSTIHGLVDSSHSILQIEGILSGTLAYVLGQVAGGSKTLSEAVHTAKQLGYTEPDPRDDLNGMDVARKAVILARAIGMTGIDLNTMTIESLVPESLKDCSVEEFMSKLSEYGDKPMADRVAAVEKTGGRLHYAAKVDATTNTVTVGLIGCDPSHAFSNAGPDNLVAITTNFYSDRPLVVQGAGAGGDVTATGVLSDILQCAYQRRS